MSYHYKTARDALEGFILAAAPKHHVSARAFERWEDLQAWGRTHTLGIDSLPVSGAASDASIYSKPRINVAFRAWHDSLHLVLQTDFSYAGEMLTADAHQRALTGQLGCFEAEAKALLWADTAGQTMYHRTHGDFPADQAAFVRAFLAVGPAAALDPRLTF